MSAPRTRAGRSRTPSPDPLAEERDARLLIGWEPFYRVVRRIPAGRVSTYGAIAEFAGQPRAARHVGYALAALRNTNHDVPWHRVLGSRPRGRAGISMHDPAGAAMQRLRLEAEGVEFDHRDLISMERFGWSGPRSRRTK